MFSPLPPSFLSSSFWFVSRCLSMLSPFPAFFFLTPFFFFFPVSSSASHSSAHLQCCHLPRSLQQPPFLHHSFCSHLFCTTTMLSPPTAYGTPFPESFSTCQSSIAASKSEVDSLWPLRMWHVARWDSDTWLKIELLENEPQMGVYSMLGQFVRVKCLWLQIYSFIISCGLFHLEFWCRHLDSPAFFFQTALWQTILPTLQ